PFAGPRQSRAVPQYLAVANEGVRHCMGLATPARPKSVTLIAGFGRLLLGWLAMPSDADRLLVDQIRAGDARAWETLIARYEGRLLAFVQRRLTDRSTAEDVVQETFIGFLNSLPNFDARRELQTYLFTIASHKITDHLRRQGRHPLQMVADEVLH